MGAPLAPPVASGSNHSPPPAKTIRNEPTCDRSTIKQLPGSTPDDIPDDIPDNVPETYPSNSTSSEDSDAGELDHLIQLGDPDRDVDFFGPLLRSCSAPAGIPPLRLRGGCCDMYMENKNNGNDEDGEGGGSSSGDSSNDDDSGGNNSIHCEYRLIPKEKLFTAI